MHHKQHGDRHSNDLFVALIHSESSQDPIYWAIVFD